MEFGALSYLTALLAGGLSTLSPCVLPLIPIVVGTASTAHRFGALALAAGLMLSFSILGTVLAYAGSAVGFPQESVRLAGAVILGVFGVVLLSGSLQRRFAAATAGVGARGNDLLARWQPTGIGGQWLIGVVLGLVWSPCAGPTLGAAIGLASQGRQLLPIMLLMGVFGVGAALPLLAVGWLGQRVMGRIRGSLAATGKIGKSILGVVFIVLSISMLTGWDKAIESYLVEYSPAWMTTLTTKF